MLQRGHVTVHGIEGFEHDQFRFSLVGGCACRNLDSAILVMKAAENRSRCDGAEPLNRPMNGSVLAQLSLPEIKSGRIDGAIRPGSVRRPRTSRASTQYGS